MATVATLRLHIGYFGYMEATISVDVSIVGDVAIESNIFSTHAIYAYN